MRSVQWTSAAPGSPQDTVEQATGLDRRGVADILNIIERTVANPAILKAVAEYRQSVATGGTISNKMISPLIRQINSIVDGDARLQARMVRPRVRGDEAAFSGFKEAGRGTPPKRQKRQSQATEMPPAGS